MDKTIRKIIAIIVAFAVVAVYSFNLQGIAIHATEANPDSQTEQRETPNQDMQGDDNITEGLEAETSEDSAGSDEGETGEESTDSESVENTEESAGKTLRAAGTEDQAADPSGEDSAGNMGALSAAMDACDFDVTGEDGTYSFDEDSGVLTITGNVTVAMKEGKSSTSQRIVIADSCTVTLDGVDIQAAEKSGPGIMIQATNTVHLKLKDGTVNNVTGAHGVDINGTKGGFAGIEVEFLYEDGESPSNQKAALIIEGNGTLNATGGPNAAGIGGSNSRDGSNGKGLYGDITIESGTVNATSPGSGAGIGSSDNPGAGTSTGSYKKTGKNTWGTITINGGTVNATSEGSGAGIGGGNHVDSGSIKINGGTVTAHGAAGIGCGIGSSKNKGDGGDKGPGYYAADIEITGGTITATSNDIGAAIGGGMYCDATISISGGTINATGGSRQGNTHHGGAGIGGGYLGHAAIEITGGDITAVGGDGAAGIGSGGSPNSNEERGTNGRGDATTVEYTTINIGGGTINATGGPKGGAGIGLGVGADKGEITITGGTITAQGAKSERFGEDVTKMAGGAGIGSAYSGIGSGNPKYFVQADVDVTIQGGTIVAIGGWGASGIGSGAQNKIANSVTIDAEKANIQAYADGTKFAIDTRVLHDDGTTTSYHTNRDVSSGYILQGTFVHNYEGEGDAPDQSPEGLESIIVGNDGTGETKELTQMPAGYRSYATDVSSEGTYTVYTDSESIGDGQGRYFSRLTTDKYYKEEAEEQGKLVQYTVRAGEISDNFYLFPVKSVVVEKRVQGEAGTQTDGLNTTAYFGICHEEDGQEVFVKNKDGSVWAESIEIKNGVPQNKAYFVNVDDKKYDVMEIKSPDNTDTPQGMTFGTLTLKRITTEHGEAFGLTEGAAHGLNIQTREDGEDLIITAELIDKGETASMTLSLFADGLLLIDSSKKLNKDTGWKAEWTVPKAKDDKEIEYKLGDTSNNATIDNNQWSDEVIIINSYEGEAGKLIIKKALQDFVDHGNEQLTNVNATFVFQITGTYEAGGETKPYSNVISMDFTKAGDNEQEVEVTGIPSNIQNLTVEEIYGGNYSTDTPKIENIQLNEAGVYEASFTNTMSDVKYKGGVTNQYKIEGGKSVKNAALEELFR